MMYISKGSVLIQAGDYQRGKETVQYGNYLLEKAPNATAFRRFWVNYYLSILFYNNNDYKTSLKYAYICLKNQKDYYISDLTRSYKLIADNLYKLGDLKNANKFYSICIDVTKKERDQRISYTDKIYTNYGHFLFNTGKRELGIKYAREGLALNKAAFGIRHPVVSANLNSLGEIYTLNHAPKEALVCYQQALIAASTSYFNMDFRTNPSLDNIAFKPEAFLTLKNKAAALANFSAATNDISQLKTSFETYQLSLDLIHKNRASFPELESKIWVSGEEKATFDGAINTAYLLYSKTGADFYKQKVFEFSEQSKAAALFASLKEKKAMEGGGIPDSLTKKENYYTRKIEQIQNEVLAETQSTKPSQPRIKDLEADIFVLKNEQSKLLVHLEKDFPSYHHLKYDKTIVSVSKLRQMLNDRQVLLEYSFVGDEILIFAIAPEGYDIYKIKKPADFDHMVADLRTYLDELSFISQTNEIYANFLKSSFGLYNLLLKPAEKMISNRNIIIVPDENLATIPFEVLLTAKVNANTEYGFLPYLITRNAIGYAYSGNLLYYQPSARPGGSLTMAAFTPSYTELNDEKPGSAHFRYRNLLKPLPFAREEATSVSRIFGGDVYANGNACESNFKKVAPQYDILHLSMHAIVDNENPMYSNLAFGKDRNKQEDGYLNTFELLNMKLKARMAVLSACNTGVGALQKGEGVMSLARGFYYAGCPDVVMTLWPVEDQLSSSLIQDFYHYLSLGKNKAEALQLAKINFLKSADPLRAHPYFWAGYVNIGDTSPLVEKQPTKEKPGGSIAWASIFGLLLTLLPFAWKLF
ncbi:MAG: CHAT domain-containing tetratricopeptide repeat protein [Bacteroidota bacterium]